MELVLLVWVVGLLNPLGFFLGFASIITGIVTVLSYAAESDGNSPEMCKKFRLWKTFFILLTLNILLPNEKTAQYMAGAYLIQATYESEFVSKAAPLAEKAVLNQLKKWAEDNKELETLVKDLENPLANTNR